MSVIPSFERAPGWVWRATGGSVLLMGADAAAVQLDGAAAMVWVALDGPATAADLVDGDGDPWAGAPRPIADLVAEALASLVGLGAVVAGGAVGERSAS